MFALGDEGEVLVGVVSEGDGACARYARATRRSAISSMGLRARGMGPSSPLHTIIAIGSVQGTASGLQICAHA